MPLVRGSGPQHKKSNNKAKSQSNTKATKGQKPQPKAKSVKKTSKKSFDDDDFDSDIAEVDGDYDFDSDVEVFDLSAMLDDPEERQKQARRGGQNKHIAQPRKGGKKSKKKLNNGDEDIDSEEEEIFTQEDFDAFAREVTSALEPVSIDHTKPQTTKKGVETTAPPKEHKTTKPTKSAQPVQFLDGSDDSDINSDDFEDDMIDDGDFQFEEFSDLDQIDGSNDKMGEESSSDISGDESFEERVEFDPSAFEFDEDDENALADFDALDGSDDDDDDDDDDDESAASDGDSAVNLTSIDQLLSKMSNRENNASEEKTRAEQLKEITAAKRRKGELFSTKEQVGDTSIRVGLANLNTGIGKLKDSSDPLAASQLSPSTPLSVSSLLKSLKASAPKSTSMLDQLRAPSLRTLSSSVHAVEKRQEQQLVGQSLGEVAKGRLQREQFYEDRSRDISKFQGIVHHNRGLQTINFRHNQRGPIQNQLTTGTIVGDFNPTNELENELDSIYNEIGRDQSRESKMTKEGQLLASSKEMSLAELEEATTYARKMKLHALFEQQRASRIAKIKSRAQRKYIRAQQEKLQNKELLDKEGGLNAEELEALELQFEKQRIKERALLTHKNTSKWAKRTMRMAAKDESHRKMLMDQLNLGRELRKKLGHKSDNTSEMGLSSDEEVSDSDFDPDDEQSVLRRQIKKLEAASSNKANSQINQMSSEDGMKKAKGSGLLHLPFMKRAQEEMARRNDEELEELKRELKMAEEYASDDENPTSLKDKLAKEARQAKDQAEKQRIESKMNNLKKAYAPIDGGARGNTASSLSTSRDVNDDEIRAVDDTVKGSSLVGKLSTMFGGAFDFDDETPSSATKSNSQFQSTPTPSLKQQEEQRNKILSAMIETSGKKAVDTNMPAVVGNDDDSASDEDYHPSVASTETQSKRAKVNQRDDCEDIFAAAEDDIFGDADDNDVANPWITAGASAGSSKSIGKSKQKQPSSTLNLSTSILLSDDASAQQASSTAVKIDISVVGDTKQSKKGAQKPQQAKVLGKNDLVSLAFSSAVNDDEDFAHAKMKEMEASLPQFDDNAAQAGWGNWAGMKKSETQLAREAERQRLQNELIEEKRSKIIKGRQDSKLKNVIISNKKDTAALKYQIQNIPYPFTSLAEYKASLRTPLGREWNTMSGFEALNKPKMIVNTGQVINAMKWNESFKGYASDGSVKDPAIAGKLSSRDVDEFGQPILYDAEKAKKVRKQAPGKGKKEDKGKTSKWKVSGAKKPINPSSKIDYRKKTKRQRTQE